MPSLPLFPLDVALIGAGSVGTGVAALLAERGQRIVGVASRSPASARRGAEILSTAVFDVDDPVDADVYLLGTPADAFSDVVERLTSATSSKDRVLVHFSGAHGIGSLSKTDGLHVCALHPVQACPSVEAAIRNLPGSTWGMTTSDGMEGWARDLIELLEGRPVPVAEEDRVAWHAAAVVTSNGIAALLAHGERILAGIGIDDPVSVLGPLASGTLRNARAGGGGGPTLTGPVVRGESQVVRMHTQALEDIDPQLADTYRAVSELIARAATAAGRLDQAALNRVTEALGSTP